MHVGCERVFRSFTSVRSKWELVAPQSHMDEALKLRKRSATLSKTVTFQMTTNTKKKQVTCRLF